MVSVECYARYCSVSCGVWVSRMRVNREQQVVKEEMLISSEMD